MKSIIKNEQGATLIFTIVVFVFVSIISVGIISVASNEKIHSIDKNNEIQAKYNAISGIELMSEYIENNAEDFSSRIDPGNYSSNFPLTKTIKDGEFTITVENVSGGIKLISNGRYSNKDVTVNRYFEKIDVTHNFLFGQFYIDTDNFPNYDPVVIPTVTDVRGDLDLKNNDIVEEIFTDETTEYGDISVHQNAELSFKTHNSAPTTRNVIVDTMDVNGAFNFTDDGRVFLFVKTKADFGSEFLNSNENLIIMLAAGAELNILINDKSAPFYAYVYGPEASVDLHNHYGFHGAIISKDYKNPGSNVDENYVPPTDTLDMLNFIDYERVYSFEPKRYLK